MLLDFSELVSVSILLSFWLNVTSLPDITSLCKGGTFVYFLHLCDDFEVTLKRSLTIWERILTFPDWLLTRPKCIKRVVKRVLEYFVLCWRKWEGLAQEVPLSITWYTLTTSLLSFFCTLDVMEQNTTMIKIINVIHLDMVKCGHHRLPDSLTLQSFYPLAPEECKGKIAAFLLKLTPPTPMHHLIKMCSHVLNGGWCLQLFQKHPLLLEYS